MLHVYISNNINNANDISMYVLAWSLWTRHTKYNTQNKNVYTKNRYLFQVSDT